MTLDSVVHELRQAAKAVFDEQMEGFEGRLATAMQKALDTVGGEYEARLRQIEEDLARLLKHTGLDKRGR